MPNNVTNIIQLQGDENKIRELLEAVKNDEHGIGTIDFNKLIPMPESLNIEESSNSRKVLKAYGEFISEYMLEKGITQIDVSDIPKDREVAFLY